MDFESLRTTVLDFVRDHQAWAPVITGIIAFCESLAVLSLLVPATVILIGIGALIGSGAIPFLPVMVGAAIGAILGDWVSYEIGRYYKDGAKRIWPLSRYPDMVQKGETFCQRWGAWAIFVGRFIGPARPGQWCRWWPGWRCCRGWPSGSRTSPRPSSGPSSGSRRGRA